MNLDSLTLPSATFPDDGVSADAGQCLSWGGLQECLQVDELTGASKFTLPLRLSPGRNGFGPDLSLTYDSRRGNGPFGVGWQLESPYVGRSSHRAVPRYKDIEDDTYEICDEELVPALRLGESWIDDRFAIGDYIVQRYRRRYEGPHDRIERWVHQPSGQSHWRTVDRNNVTSLFGTTDESRVSDPFDSNRTYRWLLVERFDDRGNIVRYEYKRESLEKVDLQQQYEKHRVGTRSAHGGARYLKRVLYGNNAPHDRSEWHFQVVLDYGEHDLDDPSVNEATEWDVRGDPNSAYRSGFEVRTWRRCRRVLMFHRFDELGSDPQLVNATAFEYDERTGRSLITRIRHTGYLRRPSGIDQRSLPAIHLGYNAHRHDEEVHSLASDPLVRALADEKTGARWLDLHSEGLPGLLSRSGTSWTYIRNLGAGRFAEPEVVVASDVHSQGVEDLLVDLSVEESESTAKVSHKPAYQPLTTFRSSGNVNQDDPYIGYLDLNGDDADDVVVADERVLRWYPSQGDSGFGDPIVLRLDAPTNGKTHRLWADSRQSFHLADMSGDGLHDLVRVRSGEVCFWPNHGRGRFGDRIVMARSPEFQGKSAGDGHILLVDLNGNGTTDLVWVGNNEICLWENRNGNSFGSLQRIEAPGIAPGTPGLDAIDLMGSGSASIVWLDRMSGAPQIRHVTPRTEQRSDLLNMVDNGRGLVVRLAYASSTYFWLRDRADGGSWLTAMPSPVHMVERMEARDGVAQTRLFTRFAYHHGYFDTAEKRFRGFAFSERWESGDSDDYSDAGLFLDEPVPAVDEARRGVPLLTKTWRHTGTQFEDADLTAPLKEEFFPDPNLGRRKWLSGNQMPLGQQARDIPESHKALHGQLLRQETYALDGPPAETIPFQVVERTCWVRQSQPARAGKPPTFMVRENERVTVNYERDTSDPRVEHDITLSIDDYGLVERHARVVYAKGKPDHPAQSANFITVSRQRFAHEVDQHTWYRIGVPLEREIWQLVEAPCPSSGRIFKERELRTLIDDLPVSVVGVDLKGPHKRLVRGSRIRYWANDLRTVLDFGQIESRALVVRTDELVWSETAARELYGEEAVGILTQEGGYQLEEDWLWASSALVSYDASRFYVVTGNRDVHGRTTTIRWDEAILAISELEDPYGAVQRRQIHPRTLKSWVEVDVNGNHTARRFDPLGAPLTAASIGKHDIGEGDTIVLDQTEASMRDDPTAVFSYDADAWANSREATWVRTRTREHCGDPDTAIQDHIVFFDGSGRRAWTATRRNEDDWIIREAVDRDANGRVVREAEPFFSDNAIPDATTLKDALHSGTRYRRDALGRTVRVDFPNGTFKTRHLRAWSAVEFERSDTVLDSQWYADRLSATFGRIGDYSNSQTANAHHESRAASLAASHARTPVIHLYDAWGRIVVTRQELSGGEVTEERLEYDWEHRIVKRIDARGLVSVVRRFDLLGRLVHLHTIDAGSRSYLVAATGEVLRWRDPQGRVTRYRYDAVGRRTHSISLMPSGDELVTNRVFYGGNDGDLENTRQANTVGRVLLRLSETGVERLSYDWCGNVAKREHRLLEDLTSYADWRQATDLEDLKQMEAVLDRGTTPQLRKERFDITTTYDALGRVAENLGPDGTALVYSYGSDGLVQAIHLRRRGDNELLPVVTEDHHDAGGRSISTLLANGVSVERRFNAAGYMAGQTVGVPGAGVLHESSIVHDADGNVMSVTSRGDLLASFTYDSTGRLVRAEGFEHVPGEDSSKSHGYSEAYTLDVAGNVVQLQHVSPVASWTEQYDFRAGSNQLRAASVSADPRGAFSATYQHDEAGHLIHGPAGDAYRWSIEDLLIEVDVEGIARFHFSPSLTDGHDGVVCEVVERPGNLRDERIQLGPFERQRRLQGDEVLAEQHLVNVENGGLPVAIYTEAVVPNESAVAGAVAQSESAVAGEGAGNEHSDARTAEEPKIRYQITDHVGSVILELDASGQEIRRHFYGPFGDRVSIDNPLSPDILSRSLSMPEIPPRTHGFRGGRAEPDAEFTMIGGRWYSPRLRRYISPSAAHLETEGNRVTTAVDRRTGNSYLLHVGNPQYRRTYENQAEWIGPLNTVTSRAYTDLFSAAVMPGN